jgi:hypothetical protein
MNNRPYNPKNLLTPLATFQQLRLEVAERAAVALAALIGQHFPAAKPQVDEILTQAANGAFQAEEEAAKLYLQHLYQQVDADKDPTYSEENAEALNEVVAGYFPIYFGQSSPLAFDSVKILEVLGKEQTFEDDANVTYHVLSDRLSESDLLSDDVQGGYWHTKLVNPLDRKVPTLIFGVKGAIRQYMAIAPLQGLYSFIAFDEGNEHYFMHHQAQYFSVPEIETVLKNNILKPQPPLIRSHYTAKGDVVTKVQVLITQIAKTWDPAKLQNVDLNFHDGYFKGKLNVVAIENITKAALYVKAEHTNVELIVNVTQTEAVIFKAGNQLNIVKYEDLPTVSLTLLEKLLSETVALLRPKKEKAKAKPDTQAPVKVVH